MDQGCDFYGPDFVHLCTLQEADIRLKNLTGIELKMAHNLECRRKILLTGAGYWTGNGH